MISMLIDESIYDLEEGFLCLDLVNTVDWRNSDHPEEDLPTYLALVDWALSKRLLDEDEAQDMLAEADRSPDEAEHALRRMRSLRDSIYQVLVSFARDVEVPYENLISLNSYLTSALMHSRLIIEEDHVSLRWSDAAVAPLDRLLWPVTRSAVALVISDAVKRIGECADDRGCGWLFYDTTRNHSRRWCSMESCGNRAKAQRHYHREQTPSQA